MAQLPGSAIMLNDTEKRAAHLAVSRYGADGRKVQHAVREVHRARSRGEAIDLMALLKRDKLLSDTQLREIGQAPPPRAEEDIHAAATVLPPSAASQAAGDDPTQDLKKLGDYRVLRRIGGGGMGSVFLGYHEGQNRQVALKVLAPALAKSPPMVDRFLREARSGTHLNHPNIVRNLAIAQDPATGLHYLVLEFIDGPSALELLEKKGHLPVGDALAIALDIARALEHAHSRNIVHRDIKPGNILITRAGVAKLADMGLAKRTDEASHLTLARQGFGTPHYMPYEQAMNARAADSRSDIYALGSTLYHLLTGEVPFTGNNSIEIVDRKSQGDFPAASLVNPQVPAVLDSILSRMMAVKPEDRYQTVSEVIVDLERTGLAAQVPTFADPTQAAQDPVVKQRLNSAALNTQADLNHPRPVPVPEKSDHWYVRYLDARGQPVKVRLSTGQIQRRIQQDKLPRQAEAANLPQGPFRPLEAYPQFRSTPRKEKPASPPAETLPSRTTWWVLGGITAAVLILVVVTLWLLLGG